MAYMMWCSCGVDTVDDDPLEVALFFGRHRNCDMVVGLPADRYLADLFETLWDADEILAAP